MSMDVQDSFGPNFVNNEEMLTCKARIVPQNTECYI